MTQDPALVLLCYSLCAVAIYTLLDVGERAGVQAPARRRRWLGAAAAAAATGWWAAALAGIKAFAWPSVHGYAGPAAAASWCGALAAAALLLVSLAGGSTWSTRRVATAVLLAAAMAWTYVGSVAALRLSPPVHYATVPLAIALALALGTGLLIQAACSSLQQYRGPNRAAVQIAAALVLAGAVCSVQFAFLDAARLAPTANGGGRFIPLAWAGAVLSSIAAAAMLVVVLLSRLETQVLAERQARERQRRTAESIRRVTYFDGVTGLPNRSQFNEALIRQLISVNGRSPPPFGVLHAEIRNYADLLDRLGQERLNRMLTNLGQRLSATVQPGDLLARLTHGSFVFLLRRREAQDVQTALDAVAEALETPLQDQDESVELVWALGSSHYPGGGNSTRALLRAAMKPQRELHSKPDAGGTPGSPLLLA